MKKSKQQKLDDLAEQIVHDDVCSELSKQASRLVFGAGTPDTDIVFVGEAPGKKEDETGEPFVGAAGKFLNQMLEMIGLKRSAVYITNIVKYRPPNNRDPLQDEKAEFMPYLNKQLEIIKPKLIVTLGRHSMDVILPGLKISQAHGQPKRICIPNSDFGIQNEKQIQESVVRSQETKGYKTWVVLPLFHPAAALYNGGLRQALLDDFAKIPFILKKIQ